MREKLLFSGKNRMLFEKNLNRISFNNQGNHSFLFVEKIAKYDVILDLRGCVKAQDIYKRVCT